jgi:hypothetical protein
LTGSFGLTISSVAIVVIRVTGTKSLAGSKRRLR